jgi:hypothetical protein
MRSYYCGKCKVNYPAEPENRSCADCGQHTFADSTTAPDPHFSSVVEHDAVGTQTTDADAHRVERYLTLRFTETDARLLAASREHERDSQGRTWTRPLNWLRVAGSLQQGCSHGLALSIYTD